MKAAVLCAALILCGGCTFARVADRDASYTRISLGGDYISHGLSFELSSNGIAKVSTAGFDNQNKDAFLAACKSLETIAAAIIKAGVTP